MGLYSPLSQWNEIAEGLLEKVVSYEIDERLVVLEAGVVNC